MCAGFHSPPIVPRGNQHRVDAIHNALIMGGSPVGVCRGKGPGLDDPVAHGFTAEIVEGQVSCADGDLGACQPPVGQVAEDPQQDPPAGDTFDDGCQPLNGGIDGVGAHGVHHIIDQVHH